MEVKLAKSAGFCFGVKRAVETVYEQIEKQKISDKKLPIYTYGPIIHNEQVVKDLEEKGVQVLNGREELEGAVKKALTASKKRRFIVEKYMQCDDMGMYYTFQDGVCTASCIYDRYTTDEQPGLSRVCLGGTYPSKHIGEYFRRMHDNACRMFRDIGIRDGVLMLSAFYEDGEFYVYDTGFRLQGEAPHLLINAVYGFDQREMLIHFALTGSGKFNEGVPGDAYLNGKWAATQWFLLKQGSIGKIEGLEGWERDPRVVANVQRLFEGDNIPEEWVGNEKQVLARLYFVCDSKEELAGALHEYGKKVKVFDTDGNKNNSLMLIPQSQKGWNSEWPGLNVCIQILGI